MNEALVAGIAAALVTQGSLPGKKSFQKLLYLIERSGVPTRLEFEMHFYGPYSFGLAQEMAHLERLGVLRVSDGRIEAGDRAKQAYDENWGELKPYWGTVEGVLQSFRAKSPWELELLATTHLAAERLTELGRTTHEGDVVRAVQTQKGGKFREADIRRAIKELRDRGMVERTYA